MALSTSEVIDLSRLPIPAVLETISFETLRSEFIGRFIVFWDAQRLIDTTLPAYDVGELETDPVAILGQAWSYLRLLDRARVNDAIKSVLAPFAKGFDLDAVAAGANVERLVIVEADIELGIAEVLESDESLLQRYLLSFDRPSAGSRDGYLYVARTTWPLLGDVKVNGWAIHGRRGDVDVVLAGPGGRLPTTEEKALVNAALQSTSTKPEATSVTLKSAERVEYTVSLVLEVPYGPDKTLIEADALARVKAVTDARTFIGGEIPHGLIEGSGYGANVLKVIDLNPIVIEPDPYKIPVCTGISITSEVRS